MSHAETTNPVPTREYVVDDYANILDNTTRQLVLNQNNQYQQTATQPQIVVMTVKSTGNLSIDDYADKLLDNQRWKFGKKGYDNGTLILLAQNGGHNNVRISTGYGVEDILPDAKTNQILQANKNALKSSDLSLVNQGIRDTFNQVAQIVSERYAKMSQKEAQAKLRKRKQGSNIALVFLILLVVLIVVAIWITRSSNHHDDHHDDHSSGSGGGSGLNSFLLGGLLGSLLSSGSSDRGDSTYGGFGSGSDFGGSDDGGFTSGGGGDFGGGGSSI
jgi:uncharacterized protein